MQVGTPQRTLASLHRLLKRQIVRHAGWGETIPPGLEGLISAINEAYKQSDIDRSMLERSLELSSRELIQANSEVNALFQALPDVFFRLSSDGTILDYKGSASGDFLVPPASLVGKRIQDIPVRGVKQQFEEAIQRVMGDGTLVRLEYSLPVDGKRRYYEARLLPLVLPGAMGQLIAIIRNITDQKEARAELAETTRSNVELERFAYIASHDLQEPLRTVQSYLQLLERRYGDQLGADAKEFIGFAVGGAKRMRDLINDLLAYARVTSRSKPFVKTDLSEVVREVLGALSTAIKECQATVSVDPLPTIIADRQQMGQLFQNLIGNALKFKSHRPVEVRLTAERMGSNWRLAVRDNGIGIAPEYFEKIFVIFQRLHTREEYAGTGIGLAICQKIVERHGGTIGVESKPGEGASFIFNLPEQPPAGGAGESNR